MGDKSEEQDPLAEGQEDAEEQDPLAEGQEGAEGQDPLAEGEEKPALPKKETAPDTQVELARAINKLSDSLARPGLTPEQQEQLWQKAEADSGLTRQQLIYQDQQIRRTSVLANLDTNKELGKLKAEKILGDESEDLVSEVEKAMASLPPEIQGNPKAWEDAAYLVLGRRAKKMGKQEEKPQRRIVGGGSAPTTKSSSTKPATPDKKYTPMEQALIARNFGGKAEEYEKYKGKSSVENDVRYTGGTNAADKSLEQLTAGNT